MVYRRRGSAVGGESKAKVPAYEHGDETLFAVHEVLIADIVQGEQLIREDQDDEEVIELASHIASHGLLQAIGVARNEFGAWQLLYGARRLAACRRLGWKLIPAHIHSPDQVSVRGMAAAENLLRRQLSLKEEVDVVCHMHAEEGRSPNEIASLVGKGRAWVLRRLAVPSLPADLREPLLEGRFAVAVCEELARIEDEGLRRYVTEAARSSNATASEVRSMVQAVLATPSMAEAVAAGVSEAQSPLLAQTVLIQCAACGAAREVRELQLVRICSGGCDQAAAAVERGEVEHA